MLTKDDAIASAPISSRPPKTIAAHFVNLLDFSIAFFSQHCLYFFPLPQKHGSFRPIFMRRIYLVLLFSANHSRSNLSESSESFDTASGCCYRRVNFLSSVLIRSLAASRWNSFAMPSPADFSRRFGSRIDCCVCVCADVRQVMKGPNCYATKQTED